MHLVYNENMNDCSYVHISKERRRKTIMEENRSMSEAGRLASLYKVFGDETRVRIMISLAESEKCVGDIAEATGVSQSAVSHQLKILKYSNLVSSRRDGRVITYTLADDHVRTIINMGLDHINEEN